ncbi:MAG TPA: DUF2182 domain-containing protein [Streptosporangiaceae bacterium]|jgi:predicted metal-binding membrane protein
MLLLILVVAAWAATITIARGMTGTMGLALAAFMPMWTLMMAAMMLPSVAPVAWLYATTAQSNRTARFGGLVAGYLAVWAAVGVPAYGLARLPGWLTGQHTGAAHILAVAIFAVCGMYQLSSLKDRCLAHCRSSVPQLLQCGSYQRRFRDLRAGIEHGRYCLGCCWGLMVILVAVGVMNLAALAALVLIEKLWTWGPAAGRLAGAAALALAVATIWFPGWLRGCTLSPR